MKTTPISLRISNKLLEDLQQLEQFTGIKKEEFIRNEMSRIIYQMKLEQVEKGVYYFKTEE